MTRSQATESPAPNGLRHGVADMLLITAVDLDVCKGLRSSRGLGRRPSLSFSGGRSTAFQLVPSAGACSLAGRLLPHGTS